MSYSFTVTAKARNEAAMKLRVAFARVIIGQPVHAADVPHAQVLAETLVGLHREPRDDENMVVSVSGACWGENCPYGEYDRAPAGTEAHGSLHNASFNVGVRFDAIALPAANGG